jgi:predicted Zn-dependent protease
LFPFYKTIVFRVLFIKPVFPFLRKTIRKRYRRKPFFKNPFITIRKKTFIKMKKPYFYSLAKGSACLAALFLFTTCARNPVTGKRQLIFMSEKREKALGVSSDPQVQESYGVYDDQKLQNFINEKGQAMAKISHRPNLGYNFRIVNSPVVNAFAVPGGYVYFTRGIMAHFNNEAQFAGVLGHEIGHITARHGAQQEVKNILVQAGVIGSLFIPQLAQYVQQEQALAQLFLLKNSRDHESQSDQLGVQYSTKIQYDSHEMAGFFKTLGRISDQAGARLPVFQSTHPDPDNRYENVLKLTEATQKTLDKSTLKINRDGYLRMIDGIVYGEDPREGYVADGKFFHPELKFQFPVPTNWKTQNTPSQFVMAEPGQRAVIIMNVGQGKTLQESAQSLTKENNLVVKKTESKKINGLDALVLTSEVGNAQQQGQNQQVAPSQPSQEQGSTEPASQQGNGNKMSNAKGKPTGQPSKPSTQPSKPTPANPSSSPSTPSSPSAPSGSSNASPSSSNGAATPVTKVLSYLIQYNNMIYVLNGIAKEADYNSFVYLFGNTMEGFAPLTDPARLNVQPDHIRVKVAARSASLGELFKDWQVPQAKMEETAILNGLYLKDPIAKGTLIKTIGK